MKQILVLLAAFLLLCVSPIYAESINLNVYGAYDFNTKQLSVFWKNTTVTYSSYIIELQKVVLTSTCGNTTLTTLNTESSYNNTITFNNIDPNYYKVIIKGINNNISTQLYTQDFFIAVSSPSFQISWCNIDPTSVTDTVVFLETTPSFTFSNPISVPEYKNMFLAKNTGYFQVLNMVFVNKYGSQMSEPSGQIIVYATVPDKPTWKGIIK